MKRLFWYCYEYFVIKEILLINKLKGRIVKYMYIFILNEGGYYFKF